MSVEELVQTHRDAIQRIAQKHGVLRVRIFGSAARGNATDESDIDLLVETGSETSAWFPAGLILDLESLLGHRVDVVTEQSLRPELREAVLHDARPL